MTDQQQWTNAERDALRTYHESMQWTSNGVTVCGACGQLAPCETLRRIEAEMWSGATETAVQSVVAEWVNRDE